MNTANQIKSIDNKKVYLHNLFYVRAESSLSPSNIGQR
ncbi:exonuclease IX [Yersinia pestis]|uniref:Exonuclease IX n=1 Tax=Yersinia pseudotuberculosis TaxID=633 RepID=A0ABM7AIK5_YERPU|nr:exonuclease IX [Yersinia pseudotuberculosis]AYW81912.1 exonuclease IX [Yersinia pestis]EIR20837.1 hypothetical protein YPPY07_1160 [Yersinia pestis PY-07]EIR35904.1 hypothetical protein YPPY10_1300 [Yersinia pestis PY-10]EIR49533.1 hypothetical protein YPPY13_1275 [Yersinia pestis PY-13]EIR64471.1 hypothetical protein YPPY19_1316 [Yersinia pestis PY-19]EIS81805.1 hypothetical protein YPPY72_1334 [Yersinia pestis PY-72]EIS90317.1 hypothetical protein YPPY76_1157 [Yersinia pestis PY-76]EIT